MYNEKRDEGGEGPLELESLVHVEFVFCSSSFSFSFAVDVVCDCFPAHVIGNHHF